MNAKIMLLIFVLGSVLLYAADTESNKLREEKIYRLVEAIWKEPPESIDVTLYSEVKSKPKTKEELVKIYESIFKKPEGPTDKRTDYLIEQRNRTVQSNVEKDLKIQETGKRIKERIRQKGHLQRIDQTIGWPEMVLLKGMKYEERRPEVVLGPNTPYEFTFINLGNPKLGDYRFCTYIHSSKKGTITNQKGFYLQESKIGDLVCWPERRLIFRVLLLGKEEDSVAGKMFVPDEQKIERLIKDELEEISVSIRPDANEPGLKDVVEIRLPKDSNKPGLILVCDKNDYSRIFYFEAINPLSGMPSFKRECDNFDEYGFPHNAAITEYDMGGKIVEKKVYKIEKVELNPTISNEVFNFNPPEDYEIVEIDPNGTSRTIREKGGFEGAFLKLDKATKTKDVETLKALLKSEFPKIRLMSLQVLKHFLAQNTEELKEMATILENDEDPTVREESSKVLLQLKGIESPNLPGKQ